ncbi:hypothetical protein EHM69_02825 [candidate division KSB1 bacterium]|nr:MAG: hypothetical protein EHM69_02825 [candidate division KSB1 bacterium]
MTTGFFTEYPMPIYEYRCSGCQRVIEVYSQTASANEPPPECRCGTQSSFERIYSAFATQNTASGCDLADCGGGEGHGPGHTCCGQCSCGHSHG